MMGAKSGGAMRSAKATDKSESRLYSVHPSVEIVQDWVASLKSKTGRSLEEWLVFIKKQRLKDVKAAREWLKAEHDLGTNSAWWLAERALGVEGAEDDNPETYLEMAEKYVEDMFAGGKAGLRPIYDRLLELGLSIAKDVKACPCKTIVPLYRKHVFAQIKPTTRTRIDLGLALAEHKGKLPSRLIDTGGLARKDRITHRIEITAVGDIDKDVEKWLKTAYGLDA